MHRVTILSVAAVILFVAQACADNPERSAQKLLSLTPGATKQLAAAREAGVLEIAPVHLPTDSAGDCNHLGWPIATMTGDTIIVMHRRIPGHKAKGAGKPDPSISYGIVVRSEDGGSTWSAPYDLRDSMTPEDRLRGGLVPLSHRAKFDPSNKSPLGYKVHLHSIGTTDDGAIVAINNHGVFRSEDQGRTWKHFSTAFREDSFDHPIVNLGPRILDHPKYGLMTFGNWFGEVDSYHKLDTKLVALTSVDGGAHWSVEQHDVGFSQYEPAAMLHNDRLLLVTRDQTRVRAHKQMSWWPGETPVTVDTNLVNPRLVDTVDLCFNPVTNRFEMVRSERHRMELWLWSMAPSEWGTGQWHRECRLLECQGDFYANADGFHPAGAVIDRERGVQHIFVYSGHPNGPAGVFRITRSLTTPKLVAALEQPTTLASNSEDGVTKGGIVMTFDDRNFDDWVKAIPLFDEFGVKATFFISGKIDGPAIEAIRQLRSHGHAIGSHSVHHLKAVEYCQEKSPDEYVRNEIQPQLQEFSSATVTPTSFAYPMSRNDAVTDETLLKVFRHLRTGKSMTKGERISEIDEFFVPVSEISDHGCLFAKGIDFAPIKPDRTFEQIDAALARAAWNQEILVLYAHQIKETGTGNFVTPKALARVISKAKELGLEFYTFDQLP